MQFLAANAAEEVTVSVSCSFKSAIRMGSRSGESFGKRSFERMHKRFGEWLKRNDWPVVC